MTDGADSRGVVWLIGAGPGDPWLITVRGRELLERADVVLYDALSHPALLEWCRPGAELRCVGKRYGERSPDQAWITAQLIEEARAGRKVARLKGGDPLLFARGAEEAQALAQAGVRFEIVPGIASPVAATAYAGISMTHRELSSSVTFITGSDRAGKEWSPEAWRKLATATDTICVLMGMRRIEAICDAILAGGRAPSTPAAVIHWGAQAAQRVVTGTLADIASRSKAAKLTNPALILVGEVVSLRDELAWYDNAPLFGLRVLVPRPVEQARETASLIRERAAEPFVRPTIRVEAPPEPARLTAALERLANYDWVLFTSANGVTASFAELTRQERDGRAFGRAKIACIGPKTAAALGRYGIRADLIAREYVAEALVAALRERGVGEGSRVLLLRALVAREVLPEALRAAGAEVDVVPAYQTLPLSAEAADELRGAFRAAAEALGRAAEPRAAAGGSAAMGRVTDGKGASRSAAESRGTLAKDLEADESGSALRGDVAIIDRVTDEMDKAPRGEMGVRPHSAGVDVALFTSSSTVHSLVDALGTDAPTLCRGTLLASIGPITSQALRDRGLWVDVEATEYTVPGLLDAIEAHLVARRVKAM
ncbi:MAG: uroporphyrinogen-III C-methyltransferase [Polyangiaceae bacterium]|nr:uroporphyrinogen-III C-methyltransferase [Polyangiaceae bacterium]MCW5789648.1 uroporphyrinogen-III C-methyltransferase [Polyangiaceae bacterium]